MEQTGVRWLNERELACWMAFLEMQKLLMETLDRELRDGAGITLDDYDVLAQLSAAPQKRLRMSELAEAVIMPKSRLTYRIDQLVKRGCVARIDCVDDRRGLFAELTDGGMALLERAAPIHVTGVRSHFSDPVGDDSAGEMCRLSAEIRDHLLNGRKPASTRL
jgi:DNA-binding MarR family transcriptional regulator